MIESLVLRRILFGHSDFEYYSSRKPLGFRFFRGVFDSLGDRKRPPSQKTLIGVAGSLRKGSVEGFRRLLALVVVDFFPRSSRYAI